MSLAIGRTNCSSFIIHICTFHAITDNVTEVPFEVIMKRQVSLYIDIYSMKKISRGKIVVEMRPVIFANVENVNIGKHGLMAFIPIHRTVRSGIIRGVPVSVINQDFKSDLCLTKICTLYDL